MRFFGRLPAVSFSRRARDSNRSERFLLLQTFEMPSVDLRDNFLAYEGSSRGGRVPCGLS